MDEIIRFELPHILSLVTSIDTTHAVEEEEEEKSRRGQENGGKVGKKKKNKKQKLKSLEDPSILGLDPVHLLFLSLSILLILGACLYIHFSPDTSFSLLADEVVGWFEKKSQPPKLTINTDL